MKITDAWVYDPLDEGKVARPLLELELDSIPEEKESIKIENHGTWKYTRFGFLVKIDRMPEASNPEYAIGAWNRFRHSSANIFPMVLARAYYDHDFEMLLGMSLGRARGVLRKSDPEWKYSLSDKDAQHGRIYWDLIQREPICKFWIKNIGDDGDICAVPSAGRITEDLTEITLCKKHLEKHNSDQAKRRIASESSK